MRRPTGSERNVGYYAIILVVVCGILWLMSSQPLAAPPAETTQIMDLLLQKNAELAALVAGCEAGDSLVAPEQASRDSTGQLKSEVASLKKQLREAQAELSLLKSNGEAPTSALSTQKAVVTGGAGTEAWAQSCAGVKLEFLRWSKDKSGNKLVCQFNAENYENWTKMPPLCDYISIECLGDENFRSAHVFGFGGPGLMIGYADVMMWEFVFARHKRHKHMVELGTMTGGTSLYFGMAARTRSGQFHTFDRSDNRASETHKGWLDNMHFHIEDILTNVKANDPSTHNAAVVEVLDVKEPIIALFDNGDKTRETHNYCRYLAVGSVLLLHDWEHLGLPKPHWEMTYSYVSEELEGRGFEGVYADFAEHIGSSTRAFIRTSRGPFEDK